MVGERCRRMKTPDGIWGANDVLGRKICRGWEMQRAGFDGERCTLARDTEDAPTLPEPAAAAAGARRAQMEDAAGAGGGTAGGAGV